MKRGNWKILVISLVIVYAAAFIGSLFTSANVNSDWYVQNKPGITPPNFVFPIAWNILFFLIALSLYFAWIYSNNNQKKKVAIIFGINLFLNILWSFLFFRLQNPHLAFFELIFLWLTIWIMIFITYKAKKLSAYLLIPYLGWVSFAGILNYLWVF